MASGAYKARYADLAEQKQEQYAEQEAKLRADFAAQIEQFQQQHAEELQRRDEQHAFAIRFQSQSLTGQAKAQLQNATAQHKRELAARSQRTATWSQKRKNIQRVVRTNNVRLEREQKRAHEAASLAQAVEADNASLHAEVGQMIKVAAQRTGSHARAAFTFNNILRESLYV